MVLIEVVVWCLPGVGTCSCRLTVLCVSLLRRRASHAITCLTCPTTLLVRQSHFLWPWRLDRCYIIMTPHLPLQELAGPLCAALGAGLQHPPLAEAALRALERLERRSAGALAQLAPQVGVPVPACSCHQQLACL